MHYYSACGEVFYGFNPMYVGLDGKPVKRTKDEYRYSYDPYVVWKGNYVEGEGGVVYSDRLFSWDPEKFNSCCKQVWGNQGQVFHSRTHDEIQKFLSLYFGHKVELTAILEGCNVSNGFPYWVFFFKDIVD